MQSSSLHSCSKGICVDFGTSVQTLPSHLFLLPWVLLLLVKFYHRVLTMNIIAEDVQTDTPYKIAWPLWQNYCKGKYLNIKERLFAAFGMLTVNSGLQKGMSRRCVTPRVAELLRLSNPVHHSGCSTWECSKKKFIAQEVWKICFILGSLVRAVRRVRHNSLSSVFAAVSVQDVS